MAFDRRPSAPPDLVEGYQVAAALARQRSETVEDQDEADAWGQLAIYCTDMARMKAVDDDQFKFQRDQQRHRVGSSKANPLEKGVEQVMLAKLAQPKRQPSHFAQIMIRLILKDLSPVQRQCFELVDGRGTEIQAAADTLGISANRVRNHLSLARIKVDKARREIEDLFPGKFLQDSKLWFVETRAGQG